MSPPARADLLRHRRQLRGFFVMSLAVGLLQFGVTYPVVFDEITETGLGIFVPQ